MSAQERMDYAGAQLKEVRDIVSSQKSEIDELRDEKLRLERELALAKQKIKEQ